MSTTLLKPAEVKRDWHIVDATDQPLGRMAATIARVLMGKNKVAYTPSADCGDFVVVVNADKIRVDARSKWRTKEYQRYSGYPGGQKRIPFMEMLAKHPDRVISLAVKRMLPANRNARRMMTRLKVYNTAEHPHANFRPQTLEIKQPKSKAKTR